MDNKVYKLHYEKNELKGFYTEDLHGENIPSPCIDITEELWKQLLKKEYQFKDSNNLSEKLIFELADINLFEEVIGETILHDPSETEIRLEVLENENTDLLIDSAIKDAKINLLENDLADVMLEIATMNNEGVKYK